MQSRLLRSFLVVAEHNSITQASDVLHVSQPALTKSIHRLEYDLGVELFERLPSGVRLTRYGEVLARHVRLMDNEYRHAVSQIEALRDGRGKMLKVGAGPVWMVKLLPPIIADFHERHPDVKVALVGGVIDTLVPALVEGSLDLICVSLDFPGRSEIIKEPLIDVRHVLIVHPSHPLAEQDAVGAADLTGHPWLVLNNDYVGTERIGSFFAANGLAPPNIAVETSSVLSMFELLRNGRFIAHVPSLMSDLAHSMGLARVRTATTLWETPAGVAYRTSDKVQRSLPALLGFIRAAFPSEPAELPQF